MFDLKGKLRSQTKTDHRGAVLLDGDLMGITGGAPIPVTEESWQMLHGPLDSDTLLLRTIGTIDYLLIGIDHAKREIFAGILDYMHSYDLRKRIESNVKTLYSEATASAPAKVCRALLYTVCGNTLPGSFVNERKLSSFKKRKKERKKTMLH